MSDKKNVAIEEQRKELGDKLADILGSENVYFQPPENLKIIYPCFVYSIDNAYTIYASNVPYLYNVWYQITYISKTPDVDMIGKVLLAIPGSTHSRTYPSDNLTHHMFRYSTSYSL